MGRHWGIYSVNIDLYVFYEITCGENVWGKSVMSYLEMRRRRWYAVLDVPKDVRDVLGKRRFVQSLKTDSLKVAEIRKGAVISEWKKIIELARRGDGSFERRLAEWRGLMEHHKREGMTTSEIEDLSLDVSIALYDDEAEIVDVHAVAFGKKVLLSEHIDAFILSKKDLAPKSLDTMRSDLLRFAEKFRFSDEVDRRSIIAWIEEDLAEGLGLAPRTCGRLVSNCRGYWKYLRDRKGLDQPMPFEDVLPKQSATKRSTSRQRLPFEKPHLSRLLAYLPEADKQLHDLIFLGAYTGARIEELCSMQLSSVSDTTLSIRDAKTASGNRDVPIHPKISHIVKRLRAESKDGYLLSGLSKNKYDDRSNAIGKRFGRLKKKAGFDGRFVFHSFRKGVATQLEVAGIPEIISARLLGHDVPTMTYGLYSGGNTNHSALLEALSVVEWKSAV
ncbi:tyrosine-type recombinase/integrase [Celeribacter halophilus]|uniref:tyrosine-type recombinase/integrase n=1 Tax=Celeribacter halophilus TaxID=576117 RepID=UPI003A917C49